MPSGACTFLFVSIFFVCIAQCRGTTAGLRSDTDKWLGSYEDATNMANETLSSIQVSCELLGPLEALAFSSNCG